MIDIFDLRRYYEHDSIIVSEHAAMRFKQRGLKLKDIRYAVNSGIIIEQYPDDVPFASCLIMGRSEKGQIIHVVMSDEGTAGRIITAYYPDPAKWDMDFIKRKEQNNEMHEL